MKAECPAEPWLASDPIPMTRARAQRETSAGGVVYRLHEGHALFLLIRDSYQNWGFPKGHLESGERSEDAALREVREETGIDDLALRGQIETIDWYFRFRGQLIHKVCHFYLMETGQATTNPQQAEGITACRWVSYDDARSAISYANARKVLARAHEMIEGPTSSVESTGAERPGSTERELQLGLPLDLPRRGECS
jgi:8-oxo-dGTP pyrophosphatase MutT (NUDIX family)